jgi:hypothetical protein
MLHALGPLSSFLNIGLFLKSKDPRSIHPSICWGAEGMAVTFPDSADMVPGSLQGYPPWVSVLRAQDVARLLLLPKDVPTAFKAINEVAVKGLPQEVRATPPLFSLPLARIHCAVALRCADRSIRPKMAAAPRQPAFARQAHRG